MLTNKKIIASNPLFMETRISTEVVRHPPCIAVGLPRSGSSFLAGVVSQLDDWYMFDDLYIYREVKSIGALSNDLSAIQIDKLLFFLGWQIRARIKSGIFSIPNMQISDVDAMNNAISIALRGQAVRWFDLLEEWMLRLAHHQNCTHWGYKAPQDFMHLNDIYAAFPGLKLLFIIRDPRAMMASLKYVRVGDGEPRQYHPVFYSLYWKNAAQIIRRHSKSNNVLRVQFERLASAPKEQAETIARYLHTSVIADLETEKSNTSFSKEKRKTLNGTEIWLCQKLIGQEIVDEGFELQEVQINFFELLGLVKTTFIFFAYQLQRVFSSRSSLVSISSFIKTNLAMNKSK